MSPAEKEARQMIADKKAAKAADIAYQKSLRNTEDSQVYDSFNRALKRAKSEAEDTASSADERASRVNPMGDTYKKGGKVSSASKRADGCCVKGKTRGKMM